MWSCNVTTVEHEGEKCKRQSFERNAAVGIYNITACQDKNRQISDLTTGVYVYIIVYEYTFYISSGGWGKIYHKMGSPRFHVFSYTSCVDLTRLHSQSGASWRVLLSLPAVLVTTSAAQVAVVCGCVSMSTRPDP